MKKIFKKEVIIAFIIGIILASSIAVYAYSYYASDISYTKPGTTTAINVETALNDLYSKTEKDWKVETITINGSDVNGYEYKLGYIPTYVFIRVWIPNQYVELVFSNDSLNTVTALCTNGAYVSYNNLVKPIEGGIKFDNWNTSHSQYKFEIWSIK